MTATPFSALTRGISRRDVLLGAASVAALGVGMGATPVLAQRRSASPDEVPVEELMKAGPLPDVALGKAGAPVTIVEYASLTCSHCASFHNNVFPALKAKYIETGKVRFILREFPLDNLAAGAAMLARCAGGDATYAMLEALFKTQEKWAFVRGSAVPELFKVAKEASFTQERFDACLNDKKTLELIVASRDRASKEFGVNSTPTFFINGKRLKGSTNSIGAFDQALTPLLNG